MCAYRDGAAEVPQVASINPYTGITGRQREAERAVKPSRRHDQCWSLARDGASLRALRELAERRRPECGQMD